MPPAFCEREDVRLVLQKSTRKFDESQQLSEDIVAAAIEAVSRWFANQTDAYFYDSTGSGTLVDDAPASATGIIESVGSSPHRQGAQVFHDTRGAAQPKYPNTRDDTFVRVQLPALFVESIDRLAVRDRDSGVTDWVAASDKLEGRDEDYYLQVDGSDNFGRSYLYLRAASIGARRSFTDLLTIDVTYGLDADDRGWEDVRRGIAALAAAQVIVDDNVLAQLPDQGSLLSAATQHEQLRELGVASDVANLSPYMGASVA
jgi:hypothetical protein